MPPSDNPRGRIDWRGWVILAWVLWFGLLYARMVVDRRSQRFREIVKTSVTH